MRSNKWNPTVKYGARAQPGSLQHGMERVREQQAADRAQARAQADASKQDDSASTPAPSEELAKPVSAQTKSLNKLFKRR